MCCSHWWRDLFKGIEDFFFSFFKQMGKGGWGGNIYGTFKLLTHRTVGKKKKKKREKSDFQFLSGTENSWRRLTEWTELLVYLSTKRTIQMNLSLVIRRVRTLGRIITILAIILCLCWGMNVELERCSSVLIAGEALMMWLNVQDGTGGETGPALPPRCWTIDCMKDDTRPPQK